MAGRRGRERDVFLRFSGNVCSLLLPSVLVEGKGDDVAVLLGE